MKPAEMLQVTAWRRSIEIARPAFLPLGISAQVLGGSYPHSQILLSTAVAHCISEIANSLTRLPHLQTRSPWSLNGTQAPKWLHVGAVESSASRPVAVSFP